MENAAPWLLARKLDALVVEKKKPLSTVVRCASALVVENARPRDEKYEAEVVEKKNPRSMVPSVVVERRELKEVQSADAR